MKRWCELLGLLVTAYAVLVAGGAAVQGDEGMWLFNNPPLKQLKARYDFEPSREWLEQVQQSSVRFNSGGSGSFVSSDGLVMTNHHVGADALQKLSAEGKDYVAAGFYARTPEEEIKCVDLELNVLMSIEDVTERINAAIRPGSTTADAQKARKAVMNLIEEESLKKTGLRSDVVTLYQGGLYHLYRYKKYTDIRLVFAPEQGIAFFGGDPDNFEYPRYDLDICFFRVYENGKPARVSHYLRWSGSGVSDRELVFVSGHPGRTDRLDTVAHLEFIRDRVLPSVLGKLRRYEVLLDTYSLRSSENARRAKDELFGVQNSRKADLGKLAGLQDPAIMRAEQIAERAFREQMARNPRIAQQCGDAWDDVSMTLRVWEGIYTQYDLLERGSAFHSELFVIARMLLRMAEETAKPNADRLREYRESNLESLRQQLFSEAPIYDDLENVKLADSLSMYIELAGANAPLVRKVLADKSPQERAAELIAGTKLKDVEVRKELAAGGLRGIKASHDPMIELARLVDPDARKVRKVHDEQVEEPLRQAYARIAHARFELLGSETYPDATFTLRLAFGEVEGYEELGRHLPPWTTIGGAFQHAEEHGNKEPFALPQRWIDDKDKLDLATPMNFVSTADIIGGNSGSPVINRNAELVGIIFDGNIQSLVWDYVYSDKQGRALAVDCRAIVESLRKVYDAGALADQLGR